MWSDAVGSSRLLSKRRNQNQYASVDKPGVRSDATDQDQTASSAANSYPGMEVVL